MRHYALKRLLPSGAGLVSANLSIGTAGAFVLATAAASLLADRDAGPASTVGAGWTLRRTIAPPDLTSLGARERAEAEPRSRPSFVEGPQISIVFRPLMAKVRRGLT